MLLNCKCIYCESLFQTLKNFRKELIKCPNCGTEMIEIIKIEKIKDKRYYGK